MTLSRPILLLAAASVLTLAGCASRPAAPEPVPVYYDGRVKPALLSELQRIRISPDVPHPARTRYASIGSRLPYYGMLIPEKPGAERPPFGEFALDPVLDVARVTSDEFRQQLAGQTALAGRVGDDGKASLQIEVIRVSIFGKDIANSVCEPLVLMRARLIDADGRPRWSSGITGNRPDDRISYPCQDIERKPEVAARAIGVALRGAVANVIARM